MSPQDIEEAIRRRKARRDHFAGVEYLRYADEFHGVPRGTVLLDGVTLWGYPSIGRILALRTGLEEQFQAPFWAEEKIDGFNARIFRHGGEILALSRGGFICPFTTDRIRDLMDVRIFDDHPDLVVCAEVAGPDTPYMIGSPPFVTEDVQLFVFDMMRLNAQGFLTHDEKTALIGEYGLPAAPAFGRFTKDQWPAIRTLLLELNGQGREGVVFKEDSPRQRRCKYVTSDSSIQDIQATAHNMLQLPPEYFTLRILRLALFMQEEGIECDGEVHQRLGQAFLDGLFEAIEQFRREHRVYTTHRCRLRRKENAERLLTQIKRASGHMQVAVRRLEWENGYYVLAFDKVYPNMTGMFGHLLKGGMVFD